MSLGTYKTGEPVREGDMVQIQGRLGEVIYLFKDKDVFWVRVALSDGSNMSATLSNVTFMNRKPKEVEMRQKTPPRRVNLPADNLGKYILTLDGMKTKFLTRLY